MTFTPSLLIVVPTFNSYHLLPSLTKSLQSQSFTDWRLLFIDGPSDQAHKRWLDDFCADESRASWINQSPSSPGIFGAMNQGFLCSRPSDWILFGAPMIGHLHLTS